MRLRCPDTTHLQAPFRGPLYVVGCGHEFTPAADGGDGPDAEGIYDCPACGMWFTPERAALPLPAWDAAASG